MAKQNVYMLTLPEVKVLKSLVAPKVAKGKPIFRRVYTKLMYQKR